MKSPEYVAVVVSTYRRALDAIAAGTWTPSPEAEQDLRLAFNRGFTRGYLFGGRHATLMARDAPDNRGIRLGTVTGRDARSGAVTVRLDGALVPATGDGLLFSDPAGVRKDWGFLLNNAPVVRDETTMTFLAPRPVAPGSVLSITSSRELENRARQISARPPPDLVHKVPVDLAVAVDAGGHISFEGTLESGSGNEVRVSYRPAITLVPARSRPLTSGQLEAQLRRSGDTPFIIRQCSIAYDGTRFAPVGELNRMRREFLARAEEALLSSSLPPEDEIARSRRRLAAACADHAGAEAGRDPGVPAAPLSLTVYADTLETVSNALDAGCTGICFEPAFVLPRHSCQPAEEGRNLLSFREQAAEAMRLCRHAGARFVLKLPKITRDYYLDALLPEIALLQTEGLSECMAENPGTAHAIRRLLPGMTIAGAAGLNIFNHRAACHLSPSFRSLTLSPELSERECRMLVQAAREHGCSASFALIVQGTAEAMVTEDCLTEPILHCRPERGGGGDRFFGIRDTTGRIFPVRTDGECRTVIGNAVETCLIDHLPAIRDAGITEVVIDARGRSGTYAGTMTRIYRDAAGMAETGAGARERTALKEQVKAVACGGITSGHFLRGLKEQP
jgi:putative protease